jgi:hypothetical protein
LLALIAGCHFDQLDGLYFVGLSPGITTHGNTSSGHDLHWSLVVKFCEAKKHHKDPGGISSLARVGEWPDNIRLWATGRYRHTY